jgi:Uma2 family endonuclease
MAQPKSRIKFTVNDYMTTPPDKRYQLLDGELILAPAPAMYHQTLILRLASILHRFVAENDLGRVWLAPCDVVLSNFDVVQPDILFVSHDRSSIVTEVNVQGAPDLVVEVLSPGTQQYDRGYKRTLYSNHGVREYWLVDPEAQTVEVLTVSGQGLAPAATYQWGQELVSPMLAGPSIELDPLFGQKIPLAPFCKGEWGVS